jgi:hypothetical protein
MSMVLNEQGFFLSECCDAIISKNNVGKYHCGNCQKDYPYDIEEVIKTGSGEWISHYV